MLHSGNAFSVWLKRTVNIKLRIQFLNIGVNFLYLNTLLKKTLTHNKSEITKKFNIIKKYQGSFKGIRVPSYFYKFIDQN